MNFEKELNNFRNELLVEQLPNTAEIVGGKIPKNKIFDIKGNIVDINADSKLKAGVISAMKILTKKGILKSFDPDTAPPDIRLSGDRTLLLMTSDDGKKYKFSLAANKFI